MLEALIQPGTLAVLRVRPAGSQWSRGEINSVRKWTDASLEAKLTAASVTNLADPYQAIEVSALGKVSVRSRCLVTAGVSDPTTLGTPRDGSGPFTAADATTATVASVAPTPTPSSGGQVIVSNPAPQS